MDLALDEDEASIDELFGSFFEKECPVERVRAAERKAGKKSFVAGQLSKTDRNGKLASKLPGLANWASDEKTGLTRPLLEKVAGVHREAAGLCPCHEVGGHRLA